MLLIFLQGPSAKRSADTDGAHALKRSRTEELEKAEKAKQVKITFKKKPYLLVAL